MTITLEPPRTIPPSPTTLSPTAPSRTASPPAPAAPHRAPSIVRDLLALIRPGQWAKNLLVVPVALLDTPALGIALVARVAWSVLLFVLASCLVYVWNDVYDRHRDRAHPTKRRRPIASGRIRVPVAYAFGTLLAALLVTAVLAGPDIGWWPLAVYLALNVAYSRGLKHLPLLDVFIVAAGFALRVVQGYLAAGTDISSWLLISVFALCLLFILGKRRHEVTVSGSGHRPALRGYSTQYLDYLIVLCSVLTVTAFLQYVQETVTSPYTDLALLGSLPFALFTIARYLQVLVVEGDGGEPTRVLLRDRTIVVASLLWGLLLGGTILASQHPELLSLGN